ncbi:MAG: lipopolysaccharide transport system permease protein [Gammaproteobacteria bacterium]
MIKNLISSLLAHRVLVYQLTRRNVIGRYRGSVIGIAWSLLIPMLMLAVYTLVFGYIFSIRRSGEATAGPNLDFAAFLFSGIVVHGFLAECLNRAPGLVTNNSQYVKKIVFPLQCLSWVALFTALFQTTISVIILVIFLWFLNGEVHLTTLLLPIIFAPLILLASGIVWFLSAISVFVRDFGQIVGVLVTMMLFLSPVFYPIEILPPLFQQLLYLNPISFIIEQLRTVTLDGELPDWQGLLIYTGVALVVSMAGFATFQKFRRGFADVL